ncbi:MAG: hypothetical protein ACP5UQ_06970 [Anaerolineae bacterium]
MMAPQSANRWYLLSTAAFLLALAALNQPPITLAVATCGVIVGLILAARGRLGRSGVVGVIGYALAAALALFSLWRGR